MTSEPLHAVPKETVESFDCKNFCMPVRQCTNAAGDNARCHMAMATSNVVAGGDGRDFGICSIVVGGDDGASTLNLKNLL